MCVVRVFQNDIATIWACNNLHQPVSPPSMLMTGILFAAALGACEEGLEVRRSPQQFPARGDEKINLLVLEGKVGPDLVPLAAFGIVLNRVETYLDKLEGDGRSGVEICSVHLW